MKVLVTGSRNWTDPEPIRRELEALITLFLPGLVLLRRSQKAAIVIYHGNNGEVDYEGRAIKGADKIAGQIANEIGFTVVPCPADWGQYGKSAGPRRNAQMLKMLLEGDGEKLVLAFHEDLSRSRGTKDMIQRAIEAGVTVKIISKPKVRYIRAARTLQP